MRNIPLFFQHMVPEYCFLSSHAEGAKGLRMPNYQLQATCKSGGAPVFRFAVGAPLLQVPEPSRSTARSRVREEEP